MNPLGRRTEEQRKAALRFSVMMWTAGVALVAVVVLIVGLSNSAPPRFFSRAAIGVAVLLLIIRQINRRLRRTGGRAAEPDPRSTLKLD